jgi:hypothetical protein
MVSRVSIETLLMAVYVRLFCSAPFNTHSKYRQPFNMPWRSTSSSSENDHMGMGWSFPKLPCKWRDVRLSAPSSAYQVTPTLPHVLASTFLSLRNTATAVVWSFPQFLRAPVHVRLFRPFECLSKQHTYYAMCGCSAPGLRTKTSQDRVMSWRPTSSSSKKRRYKPMAFSKLYSVHSHVRLLRPWIADQNESRSRYVPASNVHFFQKG